MDCSYFTNCHISFYLPNKIHLSKCCLSSGYPVIELYLNEWFNIENKVDFLNNYFLNKWLPSPQNKEVIKNSCWKDLEKCESKKHLDAITQYEVSIDATCNINCKFCFKTKEREIIQKDKNLLNSIKQTYFETLNNIIDNSTSPITIRLTDQGESLLPDERLYEVFEKAEKNENVKNILLTTNGVSLCSNTKIFEMLNKSTKIKFHISLNGLTRERRKYIMGIDTFEKTIMIINYFRKAKKLERVSYVVDSIEAYNDIKDNIETFEKMCPGEIRLSPADGKPENNQLVAQLLYEFPNYLARC